MARAPRVPKRAAVTWKGSGRPSAPQRDRLAVEHDRAHGQRACGGDHLGQPRRDVVERAREQRDVGAVAMHLQARAVELPVDRGGPGLRERGADVGGRAGEHRRQRPADLEPDRRQPLAAVPQRDRRDRREVAAQHQRAPQLGRRQARGARDRVGHHARERALRAGRRAAAARGTPARRRPRAPAAPAPRRAARRPSRRRPSPRSTPSARSSSATVSDASRRGRRPLAQQRPADPDLALGQLARQPAHDRGDLVGSGAPEQRREHGDLLVARRRRRHRGRRVDELDDADHGTTSCSMRND